MVEKQLSYKDKVFKTVPSHNVTNEGSLSLNMVYMILKGSLSRGF